MKSKEKRYLNDLAGRLAIALLLPLKSFSLFYLVFTPLTIYFTYFFLNLFYSVQLDGSVIYVGEKAIEIIRPCVAGSAYYLLAVLNLATKGLDVAKRIKLFIFTSAALLAVNLLRIFVLTVVLVSYGTFTFTSLHLGFWLVGSTLFVVGIWIAAVRIYEIKDIPFYSDLREVMKFIKKS